MKNIELPVIALAVALHMLPRPMGVSSVGATALYAGAFGDRRTSWLVVAVPLTLGLLVTGTYEPIIFVAVLLGFALSTPAGWLLSRRRSPQRFAVAVLLGAGIFYVVANGANWYVYYPHTAAGLTECYLAGLPYLGLSMLADGLYVALLFAAHCAIRGRRRPCVAA